MPGKAPEYWPRLRDPAEQDTDRASPPRTFLLPRLQRSAARQGVCPRACARTPLDHIFACRGSLFPAPCCQQSRRSTPQAQGDPALPARPLCRKREKPTVGTADERRSTQMGTDGGDEIDVRCEPVRLLPLSASICVDLRSSAVPSGSGQALTFHGGGTTTDADHPQTERGS